MYRGYGCTCRESNLIITITIILKLNILFYISANIIRNSIKYVLDMLAEVKTKAQLNKLRATLYSPRLFSALLWLGWLGWLMWGRLGMIYT